jgi:hypothetical protein
MGPDLSAGAELQVLIGSTGFAIDRPAEFRRGFFLFVTASTVKAARGAGVVDETQLQFSLHPTQNSARATPIVPCIARSSVGAA